MLIGSRMAGNIQVWVHDELPNQGVLVMRYHDRVTNYAGNHKAIGRISSLTTRISICIESIGYPGPAVDRYETPGLGYSVERVSGLHVFHAYCIASAHSVAVAVTHSKLQC